MTNDILNLLTQAANNYGVSPDLVIAVATQESGGDPRAVSPAGAQGVMQLMPATAASLGVSDPFNPAQNIDGGVRYLASLLREFGGDFRLALAAYNWGPGNVSRHGLNNWPSETVHYVSTILAHMGAAVQDATQPIVDVAANDSAPLDPTPTDSTGSLLPVLAAAGIGLWLLYRSLS